MLTVFLLQKTNLRGKADFALCVLDKIKMSKRCYKCRFLSSFTKQTEVYCVCAWRAFTPLAVTHELMGGHPSCPRKDESSHMVELQGWVLWPSRMTMYAIPVWRAIRLSREQEKGVRVSMCVLVCASMRTLPVLLTLYHIQVQCRLFPPPIPAVSPDSHLHTNCKSAVVKGQVISLNRAMLNFPFTSY